MIVRALYALAVVIAIGLFVLLLLSSKAGAATEVKCGNAGTAASAPQDVRVTGVDCATGKRLARRHANRTGKKEKCDLRKASCTLDGWTCKRTFFGNSGTKVSCKLSFGRVTWIYGT